MDSANSVHVVIVAGGSGQRMGTALPKQFLNLCGKPVLYWSVKAFLDAMPGARIILVLPQAQISLVQMVLQHFPERVELTIVAGGDTRYASVANGLKEVPSEGIVMVHDGARPLISAELLLRCYEGVLNYGTAIPVIAVTDSIRQVTVRGNCAVTREDLRIVQTPQCFNASILKDGFTQSYRPLFTDEASVIEWNGGAVHLVEGERSNLKITTPDDLTIAEALLQRRLAEKRQAT